MKNSPFVLGFLIFLFGALSHVPQLDLPYDARAIEVAFLEVAFTLDVLALIGGALIMASSWMLSRLLDV
jgi:hypothetical protein